MILFFIFANLAKSFACECEHPGKPTMDKLEIYSLVILAKVDSISQCVKRKGKVYLEGIELYKGIGTTQHFSLEYQCKGACAIDFLKGDNWLIFAEKDSVSGELRVNLCSRTRKQYPRNIDDVHTIYNEATWEEEVRFLRNNLGLLPFVDKETSEKLGNENVIIIDKNRQLSRVIGIKRIWVMLGSGLGFILFFLIAKKIWK